MARSLSLNTCWIWAVGGICAGVVGVCAPALSQDGRSAVFEAAAGAPIVTVPQYHEYDGAAAADAAQTLELALQEGGVRLVKEDGAALFGRYAVRARVDGRPNAGLSTSVSDDELRASRFVRQYAERRRRDAVDVSVGGAVSVSSGSVRVGGGRGRSIGIDVTSRANVRVQDFLTEAAAGALVRVGEDLDLINEQGPRPGQWYFFISVDGGAVTWRPESGLPRDPTGGLKVQDYVTVGEGQAGVAMRVGLADVALAYVYRDWSHRGYKAVEQYGGATVSFKF